VGLPAKYIKAFERLLCDLKAQSGDPRFEVLVADNGSADGTRAVVERHASDDHRVRYLFEPTPGASSARNAGIAAARAPILAFIDDDVRPRPDWVCAIVRAFAAHPEVDCIGGRVEPRWPTPPPRWLTPAHWPPIYSVTWRLGNLRPRAQRFMSGNRPVRRI